MADDPGSLANLRDLAVPDPVALWPPAPGIWIVAAGLAATGALWLRDAMRRRRADAYRRAALAELDRIAGSPRLDGGVERISAVMKRAALAAYPRADVASLTGGAWAGFVVAVGGQNVDAGLMRALLTGAFGGRDPDAVDLRRLIDQARTWVRDHRVPDTPEEPRRC
ncbi:DUF4381 domain-containing protein [Methylobacterium durans]|uniref:DUF4381 domain-containing protein n=1 Tax=Methylobacterium durans TaxID=2202825 RepID=A0A2U8WHG9_9HYPH|nr:DUF4381 domain-containing protein [Methylobacterium durans]AWN44776.1 DUF4381 domain-containing protein [Methylobacterium durans]